jgi:hypothetical protein
MTDALAKFAETQVEAQCINTIITSETCRRHPETIGELDLRIDVSLSVAGARPTACAILSDYLLNSARAVCYPMIILIETCEAATSAAVSGANSLVADALNRGFRSPDFCDFFGPLRASTTSLSASAFDAVASETASIAALASVMSVDTVISSISAASIAAVDRFFDPLRKSLNQLRSSLDSWSGLARVDSAVATASPESALSTFSRSWAAARGRRRAALRGPSSTAVAAAANDVASLSPLLAGVSDVGGVRFDADELPESVFLRFDGC